MTCTKKKAPKVQTDIFQEKYSHRAAKYNLEIGVTSIHINSQNDIHYSHKTTNIL